MFGPHLIILLPWTESPFVEHFTDEQGILVRIHFRVRGLLFEPLYAVHSCNKRENYDNGSDGSSVWWSFQLGKHAAAALRERVNACMQCGPRWLRRVEAYWRRYSSALRMQMGCDKMRFLFVCLLPYTQTNKQTEFVVNLFVDGKEREFFILA